MKTLRRLCAVALAGCLCIAGLHAAETDAELCARWLESIELDSPAEVLREAQTRMAQEGDLRQNGEALALYARALSITGSSERAFQLLEEANPSEATRPRVQLALARIELEQDRLTEVVARLDVPASGSAQTAPLRYAEQPDAWWLLGKAHYRLGATQAAEPLLQHFVKTWRLHPEAPSAWYLLSQIAIARRDLDAARRYRDQGQNLSTWHGYYRTRRMQARANPKDHLPHYGLAQLWSSVDELARASQALDVALQLAPDFARGWALRGELLRKQNQTSDALAAYTKALKLDPKQTDARYNRALLAMQTGADEVALQDLRTIVDGSESSAPRYLGAHLALARLLLRVTESELAQKRYARYRQLGGTEPLTP